jgi:hypothetical protein
LDVQVARGILVSVLEPFLFLTGAPCNKGVGDVGTGPNSRTEQFLFFEIGEYTTSVQLSNIIRA